MVMVYGQYAIWITFNYSCVITKIHNSYYKIGKTTLFWHTAKVFLYSSILYNSWSMYTTWTKSTDLSLIYHYITYNIDEIMDTFWHRANVYVTCIKSLVWLIQSTHITTNIYNLWKIVIVPVSATHDTGLLYQIWIKSTHSFWDITTNTQTWWKNCHSWSLAQSQILLYMH